MKPKILSAIVLLPLVIVIAFAVIGITFNYWVYIILGITCPLVAGTIWFIYKDTERKVKNARRGLEKK